MDNSLFLALIVVLTTSGILSLTFFYLHSSYRQPYLLAWGAAFASYVVRNICLLANNASGGTSQILLGAEQFFVLATAILLLNGALLFTHIRRFRWLAPSLLAGMLWISTAIVMELPQTVLYTPIYALLGFMKILCGVLLWRYRDGRTHLGRMVASFAIILWGVHQFDYPLLRQVSWFAPWGFLIGAVLGLTVAIGIIIMFFEQNQALECEHADNLRLILDNAGDAIYLADISGRIIDVNPEAERQTGYSREELLHLKVHDIDTNETEDSWGRLIREVTPGKNLSFSTEHRRKDGGVFPVEVNGVGYSQQGQLMILGVARDITKRMRDEEALRSSEEHLRVIADNTYDWEYWRGPDGTYLWVSPACSDECGLNAEELVGEAERTFRGMVHPEDQPMWDEHIREMDADQPEHREIEFRIVKANGDIVWVAHSCKPIFDNKGEFLGRRGCNRNITERKVLQDAQDFLVHCGWEPGGPDFFQELARYLANVLSMDFVCIDRLDGDGLMASTVAVYFDGHFEDNITYALKDTPCGDVVGKTICCFPRDVRGLFPKDDVLQEMVAESYVGGTLWGTDHKPIGLIAVIGRKPLSRPQLAEKLLNQVSSRAAGELERRAIEATLMRASEVAESANKSKSEFLANMSHEIRTPLNGVMGMLQLMQTTRLDEEQSEYVRMSVNSAKRLNRLLTDILDLSRIESGKMDLRIEEFHVRELFQSVDELFSLTARGKGLSLVFDFDPSMSGSFMGDETRLRQILFNLVGNAIKFTQHGTITVGMAPDVSQPEQTGRIEFTVRDTGIGIPRERLTAIFEPFTQVDGSFVRSHQGAGLGLTIVKRLLDLMGGSIVIDSFVGEGTTLRVSIPLAEAEYPQTEAPATARTDRQKLLRPALRVLIAEDDEDSLQAAKRMLEKSGYTVGTAVDGQEALQCLSEQDFDLILMDVQMPVLDGVEATRLIRASGSPRSDIPIIAMTAYAMTGDKEKFLAAEMNDYISKPVNMDELKTVIERVMEKAAASN